jgi:hypothetical protein
VSFWRFLLPPALIAASIYGALLVVDLLVALVLTPPAAEHRGLYQIDATRGHAHVPGFKGPVRTTASFPVAINSHGYRDREWTFEWPRRVLVVGDSFAFGEPLARDATLVGNLQRLHENAALRFYNTGTSGYGLAHVLETVRRECRLVRPERVLYLYYFNDTRWDGLMADSTTVVDGWMVPTVDHGNRGRRFSPDEIRVRIAETLEQRRFRFADWLMLGHVVDFLRRRGLLPRAEKNAAAPSPDSPLLSANAQAYPPELSSRAADILRALAASAEECGAAFTMVVLASDWEARLGLKEPSTERLLEGVAEAGLDILDLRQLVKLGRVLRLPNDNHYNPEAAAWAAQRIKEHLAERSGEVN